MTEKTNSYYWRLIRFGFILLTIVLFGSLVYFSYQGAQIYVHPPRTVPASDNNPAFFGTAYQEISLRTSDGLTLSAWFTPAENGVIILAAHGYAGHRSAPLHAMLAEKGYGVISWDARAHGLSEGTFTSVGYYEYLDVEAALTYALQQENVQHIGAIGQSMGGATLIMAAAKLPEIEAVVADSAFPSLDDMVSRVVPFAPMRPFMQYFAAQEFGIPIANIRPMDSIPLLSPRPVFLIQGLDDQVVPPDAAERLYNNAEEPKQIWTQAGVDHVEMMVAYPAKYQQEVTDFFATYLLEEGY